MPVLKHALSVLAVVLSLSTSLCAVAQLPDPVAFRLRIELGDAAKVREWLDAGLPADFEADQIGTGLMIAAWEGQTAVMEALVARGADVNRTNARGEQALLLAAWRGNLEQVKWLLSHGAQLNREPMSWTALHYAAFAGHSPVVQYLIERGADINARSTNGSSVLMMAAYEGHEALARQLVSLGADPSVRNDRGEGALEWAMKFQHLGIARLVSDRQQFIAAANQPKEQWGAAVRSLPPPAAAPEVTSAPAVAPVAARTAPPPVTSAEIERLLRARSALAAKGLTSAVNDVDRQIAAARARAVTGRRTAERTTALEITASRTTPRAQKARLVTQRRAR